LRLESNQIEHFKTEDKCSY